MQPMNDWDTGESYFVYAISVDVPGLLASDNPVIDIFPESYDVLTRPAITGMLKDWAKIAKASTGDGGLTLVSFEALSYDLPIKIMCVR